MRARAQAAPALRTPSERRRSRILEVLRESDQPLDVEGLAARLRVHPNTVRLHVRALHDAGLVAAETKPAARGRPRTVYRLSPGADRAGRADEYRRLAGMLAGAIASTPNASEHAEQVGESWGRYMADETPPFATIDGRGALSRLEQLLDRLGFEPELDDDGHGDNDPARILMHRCPFRDVASEYPTVVCPLHLGVLRGTLAALGAPAPTIRLDPFVEPSLCIATIGRPQPTESLIER